MSYGDDPCDRCSGARQEAREQERDRWVRAAGRMIGKLKREMQRLGTDQRTQEGRKRAKLNAKLHALQDLVEICNQGQR